MLSAISVFVVVVSVDLHVDDVTQGTYQNDFFMELRFFGYVLEFSGAGRSYVWDTIPFIYIPTSTTPEIFFLPDPKQSPQNPGYGPDLMTYVWIGISFGGLIGLGTIGWVLTHFGPFMPMLVSGLMASLILVPLFLNYMQERNVGFHSWIWRSIRQEW